MPLASPPGRPDVVYGFGRIDASGRVADRVTIAALGWRGGDRLTLTADAGVMIARRDPGGMITVPARPYVVIPAALRARRAPWLTPLARAVFLRRQLAVPGQQRRWRHGEDSGPAPARYKPRQRGEPGPVGRLIPHPAGVPPQYRVLMPENQQLSILRQVAAEHQDSQAEYPAREQVDDLEQHPAS